jgi:hypothetical protein
VSSKENEKTIARLTDRNKRIAKVFSDLEELGVGDSRIPKATPKPAQRKVVFPNIFRDTLALGWPGETVSVAELSKRLVEQVEEYGPWTQELSNRVAHVLSRAKIEGRIEKVYRATYRFPAVEDEKVENEKVEDPAPPLPTFQRASIGHDTRLMRVEGGLF